MHVPALMRAHSVYTQACLHHVLRVSNRQAQLLGQGL